MHAGTALPDDDLCELTLRSLPVRLFLQADQHVVDVVRELFLMINDAVSVPPDLARLASVADDFARVVAPVRNGVVARVQAAYDAGVTSLDLRTVCPRSAVPVIEAWDAMLDELDDLSRRGVLLCVPASPQITALRRWHHRELVAQLRHGRPARTWTGGTDGASVSDPDSGRHSFA